MAYETESLKLMSDLEILTRNLSKCGGGEKQDNDFSYSKTSSECGDSHSGSSLDELVMQITEALKSNSQRHEMVLEHLDEVESLVGKLVAHKEAFKSFTLNSNTTFSRFC